MSKRIEPIKKIQGEITMPGDKSISHRAVMLGAISKGVTRIKGMADCDDCNFTIRAFKEMGIPVSNNGKVVTIEGKGLKGLARPKAAIHAGNSGTTMRLLAGILAGQDFEATLMGDESLSKRPMERIAEPLTQMGVDVKTARGGYPPITIKGGELRPIDYRMQIPSAQVKSAVLFAGLYAEGITTVEEPFKSRDHTERMMKYFGASLTVKGLKVGIDGKREMKGKTLEIPGDISSASFFIAAAILLKGSKIRISNVGINPTRAGILKVLSGMGAKLRVVKRKGLSEPVGDIEVVGGATKGITIDEDAIPGIIDELPLIFVLASVSKGHTVIKGAEELRVKETDRISSMKKNLEMMGARIDVKGDSLIIDGVSRLNGAPLLKSFGDHRTCMATAIAALAAGGESMIDDVDCVGKSFPGFFDVLDGLKP